MKKKQGFVIYLSIETKKISKKIFADISVLYLSYISNISVLCLLFEKLNA